jgi:putative transposase
LRYEHHVKTLCRVLRVNRSTYYKFANHKPSARDLDNQIIRQKILTIHSIFNKSLGVAKINTVLARDYGINISNGRVYRLMKSMHLPKMSTDKPKFKSSVNDTNLVCHNNLNQQFQTPAPNLVWCSDFTYIKVATKTFVYLCVILDLFSRKIIAWHVSPHINSQLAIDTLHKAVACRSRNESLLFHMDQGSQFTSAVFRKTLDKYNITASYSKKAHPWDNAVIESFFKSLKREQLNRMKFTSLKQVHIACFEYINRYNSKRPHATLNMNTPNHVEELFWLSAILSGQVKL